MNTDTIMVARSKKSGKYFRYDDDQHEYYADVSCPLDPQVCRFSSVEYVTHNIGSSPEEVVFERISIFWDVVEELSHPDLPKLRGIWRGEHVCEVIRAHREGGGFVITIPDKFGGKHWLDTKREDISDVVMLDEAWAKEHWYVCGDGES